MLMVIWPLVFASLPLNLTLSSDIILQWSAGPHLIVGNRYVCPVTSSTLPYMRSTLPGSPTRPPQQVRGIRQFEWSNKTEWDNEKLGRFCLFYESSQLRTSVQIGPLLLLWLIFIFVLFLEGLAPSFLTSFQLLFQLLINSFQVSFTWNETSDKR